MQVDTFHGSSALKILIVDLSSKSSQPIFSLIVFMTSKFCVIAFIAAVHLVANHLNG